MAADLIRDAPLGQIVRWMTSNRYFQYPDEKAGFQLPEAWLRLLKEGDGDSINRRDDNRDDKKAKSHSYGVLTPSSASIIGLEKQPQQQQSSDETESDSRAPTFTGESDDLEIQRDGDVEKDGNVEKMPPHRTDGVVIVDWYSDSDPENPHNWSNRRRLVVMGIICLYTFVVYLASAIYTTSEPGIMQRFHVGEVKATLGLSLYVLGYGVGPLLFSPLTEIPVVGRNPAYIATMFLFVVLSVPTALASSWSGLMALRFLQGFFGSPCLASGGASVADLYSFMSMPYAMMAWVAAAYCGPALGPLLSGFSVAAESWRWSLFESIWASAPIFIAMFVLLPETSADNILLRRAKRLRALTGHSRLMSQSEMDQRSLTASHIVVHALIKPMEITLKDPAVLFVQVYTAIIYGTYYSFFEVFPLVYPVYYNMNAGQMGLVFLCILVACSLGVALYGGYVHLHLNPHIRRLGWPVQEARLLPALPASFGPTVGLFIFAWTARASIHWIAPTIGITIYACTAFIILQAVCVYIPLSYPHYAASLFAANDLFRSSMASGAILFAHPLFANLGVARGVSLLGGLSVIGIIGIFLLYFYGGRLRAMSKFAI